MNKSRNNLRFLNILLSLVLISSLFLAFNLATAQDEEPPSEEAYRESGGGGFDDPQTVEEGEDFCGRALEETLE